MVNPSTGRIHTSYNQTVAATGRLRSCDPNLQNIPIRGEEGREIRKGFVAENGHYLVSADYSQVELRVFAHYSKDQAFMDAFKRDEDIHARTASEILTTENGTVTSEMRRIAKAINTPIQGTAADLIKKAMIKIHRRLNQNGLRTRMLLQVHDELVFEVPDEELDAVIPMVREEMEGIYPLRVPLKVDINKGRNWDEAH